jgi:Ni,Fe-hydrogenase III large subunit
MKTDVLYNYLYRMHGVNSTMLMSITGANYDSTIKFINGIKLRKNIREEMLLSVYRFLLQMKDTSPELEMLLAS